MGDVLQWITIVFLVACNLAQISINRHHRNGLIVMSDRISRIVDHLTNRSP